MKDIFHEPIANVLRTLALAVLIGGVIFAAQNARKRDDLNGPAVTAAAVPQDQDPVAAKTDRE